MQIHWGIIPFFNLLQGRTRNAVYMQSAGAAMRVAKLAGLAALLSPVQRERATCLGSGAVPTAVGSSSECEP